MSEPSEPNAETGAKQTNPMLVAVEEQSKFLRSVMAEIDACDKANCCPVKKAEATAAGYIRVEDYVAMQNATAAAAANGFSTVNEYLASLRNANFTPNV